MREKHYDEYQLLKRYKIGFQTMFIFAFLIMINGLVKEYYYVWAAPFLEAIVLIYIPFLYFTLMSLLRGAYLRKSDNTTLSIIIFGLVLVLNSGVLISSMYSGTFKLIENGMLSNGAGQLLLILFLIIVFGGLIIKKQYEIKLKRMDSI